MKSSSSSALLRAFLICVALVFACGSTNAQQRQRRSPAAQPQPNVGPEGIQQMGRAAGKPRPKPVETKLDRIAGQLKLGEPQTHANLTFFLIEGDDRADTSMVLTLSEALARRGP
jgi:hypothetical protein